jgi:Lar family restriction alleviation protein
MTYNFLQNFTQKQLLSFARYLEYIPGRAEDNSDPISEGIRGIYKEIQSRTEVKSDLLPCPFCGSSKVEWDNGCDHNFTIVCQDCGAQTPESNRFFCNDVVFRTYEEAAKFWNRRA